MRKLLMIVGAIAIVASACGGDDDDGAVAPADSPLVAALAEQINEGGGDTPVTTQADAECWAGRIVGGIGEDRLNELGVTADNVGDIEDYDFTDGEIGTIVGSLGDCVDLQALMADELVGELGDEAADCVAGELSDDFLTDMMTAAFRDEEPGDEFFQTFVDIAAECDLPLG